MLPYKGLDRESARGWCRNDGEIAQAAERHIEGAGDGRRRHGEDVDLGAECLDRLLLLHAEAMFLVDDQKAEIVKAKIAL